MSQGSAKKGFRLQPEWSEDAAIAVDELLNDLTAKQTVKKTGRYRGTGAVQVVTVAELPNPPILLILQKSDGTAPHMTIMPVIGGNVIAWNNKSFTLDASSGFNTAEAEYLYLVIA